MTRIAIIAGLSSFDTIYSIANIVRTQCKYFIVKNYEVHLFTFTSFTNQVTPKFLEDIKVHKIVKPINNQKTWEPGNALDKSVKEYYSVLEPELKNYEFVITHDMILLTAFVPINIALRQMSSKLQTSWFHWVHSKPSISSYPNRSTYELINNFPLQKSYVTYPNSCDKDIVCDFFKIEKTQFLKVNNTLDLDIYLQNTDKVKKIVSHFKTDHDFMVLYPSRLNYHKRIEKLIELAKCLKAKNLNPFIVVANSYNSHPISKSLLQYYKLLISANKLNECIVFTSDLGFANGLDNQEIRLLFSYSSFFIFPTVTETCPLVMLEAAINSNVMILNKNVNSLKELAGDNAHYLDFESDAGVWMQECFEIIQTEMKTNKLVRMKNRLIKNFTSERTYDNFNRKVAEIIRSSN